MRVINIAILLLAATAAYAQVPAVNESTGDLSYGYAFKLPKARGRYQPQLALTYSSASRDDRGYGFGWSLSASYVERDTRGTPGKVTRWLVSGNDRKLLVQVGSTYRAEVEEGFFEVTESTVSGVTTYTAYDGNKTKFTFGRVMGARSYLTRIEDLDGDITEFAYDADKEDVVELRYNSYPAGATTPYFASVVRLEYVADSGLSWGNVAGALLDRKYRLNRVRVMGPVGSGGLRTVRGYEMSYWPPGRGAVTSISHIAEYGGDFASSLPPTEFTYDFNGYELAPTATLVSDYPVYSPYIKYEDVDGDGRADLVSPDGSPLSWRRNLTAIGGDMPLFSEWKAVPLPPQTRAGVLNDIAYLDFDGDGIIDVVRAIATTGTSAPYYHEINRGVIDPSTGNLTFSTPAVVLDVSPYGLVSGSPRHLTVQSPGSPVDLNGDGVLDYARMIPVPYPGECGTSTTAPCAWEYGLTVLDWANPGASRVVKQAGTLDVVPGGPWFVWPVASKFDRFGGADLNGDGLADAFSAGGATWSVALNLGVSPSTGLLQLSKVPTYIWSTTLDGYADYPWITVTSETDTVECGKYYTEDTRYQIGDLLDLNGDGKPDFVLLTEASWNSGRQFSGDEAILNAPAYAGYGAGYAVEWNAAVNCGPPTEYFPCFCSANAKEDSHGQYADVNGDGIPDFIRTVGNTYPVPLELRVGQTTNGLAHPALMKSVTTPDGATFTVEYVPSTTFGVPARGRKPVVTALSVGGTQVQPNATYYWYGTPAGAIAWYEPNKYDDRGFAESWSQDTTTRLVRHTRYRTESHALIGRPSLVESGYPSGRALGTKAIVSNKSGPPGGITWFAQDTYEYGQKQLMASTATSCISRVEPAATDYPLRVIATRSESRSIFDNGFASTITDVACTDVDPDGHVLVAWTTPRLLSVGQYDGKVLVTKQTFTGTTLCNGVPAQLNVTRWDANNKLSEEVKTFDAQCRLTSQYSPDASGAQTNRTTYTYNGPFGQMDTSTSGGVTKRTTYDAEYGLYVTEERTEDSLTTLATSYAYDSASGFRLSVQGPYLVKRNGAPATSSTAITRYYRYDVFGRMLAVAKQPFTADAAASQFVPASTGVNQAVEAYEYLDNASPRAVVSYRFSVARTYTSTAPTGQIPQADDVAKTVTYRDGLGRTIQARERLGGGGTADPAARVVQSATGYKITTAFLDGAGRTRVALEPFYDAGEAFVDYSTAGIPGTRGTVTTYDDQIDSYTLIRRGQPWCTAYQYISGALPGAAMNCRSDSTHSSTFRLATETWATMRTVSGRGPFGGNFVAQLVIPPEVNVLGSSTPRVVLKGAAGEDLGAVDGDGNYTWIDRDAMGREIGSWREAANGSLATPQPASRVVYNLAGQVVENWDANSTKVTRKSLYDEAGRLIYVTTDPSTGEGIQYVYGAGDLGRASAISEVTYSTGIAIVKLIARNHYDAPYLATDAGYAYVAGKLAWTENGDTVIAYGYDDAGRVWRRDQWFARLDATKRFTVSSTYGADGRVLDSRVVNPYSASAEYQYTVDYDSAGHPVGISGGFPNATAPQNVFQRIYETIPQSAYGSYDALGRVPAMKADNGYVVSARKYNAYSGQLEGECKRFDTTTACTGTGLDSAKDIFRTDVIPTTYEGGKLKSFTDSGTGTQYTASYLASGRLQSYEARPTGAVGSLTQDWLEAFAYNGIGNIDNVQSQRNTLGAGNPQPKRYASERYTPESPASGQVLDRVAAVTSRTSETAGGTPVVDVGASTTTYEYDLLQHLTKVTRSAGESESLYYAPGGELLYRQIGEKFVFYVGEYATVTAQGVSGCGASCVPQAATVQVDAHIIFAGMRIASAKPSRTLYYYRTRLDSVIATSLNGGRLGAAYRYGPHGESDVAVNDTPETSSELGYTNALKITGSLLYMESRVYDTAARVFVQPDIIDRLRYAYVEGDPVNLYDPTGLQAQEGFTTTSILRDGSVVRVIERDGEGNLTVKAAYDTQVPSERAAFASYEHQVALQKEQKRSENKVWTDRFGEWNTNVPCMNCHGGSPQASGRQAWYYETNEPAIIVGTALLNSLDAGLSTLIPTGMPAAAGFAQKTFSPFFSDTGTIVLSKATGRLLPRVDDLAGAILSGAVDAKSIPVNYVVRDGYTLIADTRSAAALKMAGVPRSEWNAVNQTASAAWQARVADQLTRGGLTSAGTATVRMSGTTRCF